MPLVLTFLLALMFALSGCEDVAGTLPGSPGSGRSGDAAIEGSVTYRERLALTPGARLVVELRDVSLADAAAPLIASRTITNPGQVPIDFRLSYDSADINPRNTYAVRATIFESDGRMAFTNDTAYEVITRGNPDRVDMRLVMVQPPPGPSGQESGLPPWVETPVQVISANLIPNEPELLVRVVHIQSAIDGCALRGNRALDVEDTDIIVRVTLMQPPDTPWAIPCDEETVVVDEVLPIEEPLAESKGYRIIVNGQQTSSFTLPDEALGFTHLAESVVRDFRIEQSGENAADYQLRVVSGRPSGSCTQVNGYEITRRDPNTIEVAITHHQVSDPNIACTRDFPITETVVPLGSGFQAGTEYTVKVNDESRTFTP